MSEFKLLMPHEVLSRWEGLSSLLRAAVEQGNGECDVEDIPKLVCSGRMFVFASDQFALTAEFVHYPQKTSMVVGFGAGQVPERDDVAGVLTDFAKRGGATSISTYCKNPAMTRYYRRWFGLTPVYTVLEKPL